MGSATSLEIKQLTGKLALCRQILCETSKEILEMTEVAFTDNYMSSWPEGPVCRRVSNWRDKNSHDYEEHF